MVGRTFQIIHGDIAELECEAIVNAWNRNILPWFLILPTGVSASIKTKGGATIFNQLMKKGPIPLGQAVYTGAGRLKAKYVIHVAGIDLLWRATEQSICDSTRNALDLALRLEVKEIALPLIGTGSGGFSPSKAYWLMKSEIDKYIDRFNHIYLVIYNQIVLQPEYC